MEDKQIQDMYLGQDDVNKEKGPAVKEWIYRLFAIVGMLIVVIPAVANVHYKIGVVHSYEKGYHDAERYRRTLEKELSGVGIKAEINELFLNCDELRYDDELIRASFFIFFYHILLSNRIYYTQIRS